MNKTIITLAGGSLILLIVAIFFLLGTNTQSQKEPSISSSPALATSPQMGSHSPISDGNQMITGLSEKEIIAAETSIPIEAINDTLYELLQCYKSGDPDALQEAFLRLLEQDEAQVLHSLQYLDGIVAVYGLTAPELAIGEVLFKKYTGEQAVELLASYPQASTTVRSVLSETLVHWANDDIEGMQTYFRENRNLNDEAILYTLFKSQADELRGKQMADFLHSLDDADERKAYAMQLNYQLWVETEPDEFAAYANMLNHSGPASEAISVYAMMASQEEPELALAWAENIENEDVRSAALLAVGSQVTHFHPEKFNHWLAQQKFSSNAEKQRFLSEIEHLKINFDGIDEEGNYPEDLPPEEIQ